MKFLTSMQIHIYVYMYIDTLLLYWRSLFSILAQYIFYMYVHTGRFIHTVVCHTKLIDDTNNDLSIQIIPSVHTYKVIQIQTYIHMYMHMYVCICIKNLRKHSHSHSLILYNANRIFDLSCIYIYIYWKIAPKCRLMGQICIYCFCVFSHKIIQKYIFKYACVHLAQLALLLHIKDTLVCKYGLFHYTLWLIFVCIYTYVCMHKHSIYVRSYIIYADFVGTWIYLAHYRCCYCCYINNIHTYVYLFYLHYLLCILVQIFIYSLNIMWVFVVDLIWIHIDFIYKYFLYIYACMFHKLHKQLAFSQNHMFINTWELNQTTLTELLFDFHCKQNWNFIKKKLWQ